MVGTNHVVSAGHTVIRKAGILFGDLFNDGERIEREDCVIVAIALLDDEPVDTRIPNTSGVSMVSKSGLTSSSSKVNC